jgi:hypothetical protein
MRGTGSPARLRDGDPVDPRIHAALPLGRRIEPGPTFCLHGRQTMTHATPRIEYAGPPTLEKRPEAMLTLRALVADDHGRLRIWMELS